MTDLRDIIRKAWLDLDGRVAPLRAREASLKAELRSVQQDIERLMGGVADAEKAAQALGLELTIPDKSDPAFRQPPVSIKQAIRLVLDASREGLTSAELHDAVSKLYFEGKLERTSFSPQLSRMRAAAEVGLQDTYWTLTDEGRQAMSSNADAAKRSAAAANFVRLYEQQRLPDCEAERVKILENE